MAFIFLLLVTFVAFQFARYIPWINALTAGIILGALIANLASLPPKLLVEVKRLGSLALKIGVVLLGLQISITQLLSLGPIGVGTLCAVVLINFLLVYWIFKWAGIKAEAAAVIASGYAVCGASAAVAAQGVVGGSDEDTGIALALITCFGTVLMFVEPLFFLHFPLDPRSFGFWIGASVHEVAQVAGAAAAINQEILESAMIFKLGRVVLLAPILIILSAVWRRGNTGKLRLDFKGPFIPWFVFGFLVLIGLNSFLSFPEELVSIGRSMASFLLAAALVGLGLGIDIKVILSKARNSFAAGAVATISIVLLSYLVIFTMARFL